MITRNVYELVQITRIWLKGYGSWGGTRTRKSFRILAPKASASTNFTTQPFMEYCGAYVNPRGFLYYLNNKKATFMRIACDVVPYTTIAFKSYFIFYAKGAFLIYYVAISKYLADKQYQR